MLYSTQRYTYADYKQLDVDDHFIYELLNGELVRKSAPTPAHQRISRKLLIALNAFIEQHNLGEIFAAPIDVFLDDYNAPQPDLVFVAQARKTIITADGIVGAPDLVIEIVSPSSVTRDRLDKLKLYRKYQIPEYWIVDPKYQSVEVYVFDQDDYIPFTQATEQGVIGSRVLPGLQVTVENLFN